MVPAYGSVAAEPPQGMVVTVPPSSAAEIGWPPMPVTVAVAASVTVTVSPAAAFAA